MEAAHNTFGGRFRAERLLAEGAATATYYGTDVDSGAEVVIKTARPEHRRSYEQSLQHEALMLSHIRHASLSPLVAFGHETDRTFIVTSYVPGVTLEQRLHEVERLPLREALHLACQLANVLAEVHAHDVLHRDIKPSNIVLQPNGDVLPVVKLIDFGLARPWIANAHAEEALVGSAAYVSPEQAGLINKPVDQRSDLYSLGVVLYECLSGHRLFQGATLGESLRNHLNVNPPSLRTLVLGVPRAVDDVVQRLLKKNPRDRYPSAQAALADLLFVRDALDRGIAEPELVVGAGYTPETLMEPTFVGRATALATLEQSLEKARRGTASLVTVEAESGGGKTWLLEEFGHSAHLRGDWVIRGQGLSLSAQRPLQLLDGVASEMLAEAERSPELAVRWRAALGDQSEALRASFPQLGTLFGERAPGDLGPEEFGENRTIAATCALLDALGTRERPALLMLDDAQWTDTTTMNLLKAWCERDDADASSSNTPRYVLVVVAFRPEEISTTHPISTLRPAARVLLRPFDLAETRRLAASMAGDLPANLAPVLSEFSGGNPFMITALLQGLVEMRAMSRRGSTWQFDERALGDDLKSSQRAAAFLTRRLETLPEATLQMLSAGALLGKAFDLGLAAALVDRSPTAVRTLLVEAKRRHIVWLDAAGTHCTFVHDKIREVLVERISPDKKRALHLTAARQIQSDPDPSSFELAYHFDAGGDSERALPYAMRAAEHARERYSLEIAEVQYRIAQRGAERADQPTRRLVSERLGEVLMLRGKYGEAEARFERALALADADDARARVYGKLGELSFKRGDMQTASKTTEQALRLLGVAVPTSNVEFAIKLIWEIVVQVLHCLLAPMFLARHSLNGAARKLVAARLYSRLGYVYWYQRGKAPCMWAHLRELNLVESYAPTPELGQAYSEHAPAMTMIPYFSRGLRYAERALAIRRERGDIWGQGQSMHFYGLTLLAMGRVDEAKERFRESVRLLERTGDKWETNNANWHIGLCEYRRGHLGEAIKICRDVHEKGAAIGDGQASNVTLGILSLASRGRISAAELHPALAAVNDEDVATKVVMMQAEAVRLMALDDIDAAVAILTQADAMIRKRGLRQEYVAPIPVWLMTALRRKIEGLDIWATAARTSWVRRARRARRRGLRVAKLYRNNLPHALREAGLIDVLGARPQRARVWFQRSLRVARSLRADDQHAETLGVAGRIGVLNAWPGSDETLHLARQSKKVIDDEIASALSSARDVEEVESLSLIDRFATVLDAGRKIACALSTADAYDAARAAIASLVRADRCLILEVTSPTGEVKLAGGQAPFDYSTTLVRATMAAGEPTTSPEQLGASDARSLVLSGARSALCAPIFVKGRIEALLYMTHQRVEGLFDQDSKRLALFITTLAGTALENAASFDQIKLLSSEKDRLYQAAQRAISMRDDFISIASHELRTPLTALRLHTQMLGRFCRAGSFTPDKLVEVAAAADKQLMRLTELIDKLLNVSRITSGQLTLDCEPLDASQLVHDVVRRMDNEITAAACSIKLDVEPHVQAFWDRVRMDQVITNVVSNAVKYGRGRRIEIGLQTRQNEARLTFRDHGIGIAKEHQDKIFDRFERAVSFRSISGLGLGLFIAKEIVAAHGGSIRVESEEGDGALFVIDVPLGAVKHPSSAQEARVT